MKKDGNCVGKMSFLGIVLKCVQSKLLLICEIFCYRIHPVKGATRISTYIRREMMIEFRDDDGSTTVVVEAGEKLKIWFTST